MRTHLHELKWMAAAAALMTAQAFTGQARAADEHYLIVREAADGQLSVVSRRLVHTNRTLRTHRKNFLKPHRQESLLAGSMVDKKSGSDDFDVEVLSSSALRAEFHDHDGDGIEGHAVPAEERFYVVRVPARTGKMLKLRAAARMARGDKAASGMTTAMATPAQESTLTVDLDQAPTTTSTSTGSSSGFLIDNGDSANRLDLLVVAEGYTAEQKDQFIRQATTMANTLLSISPYSDFKQLVNVRYLFVPSNQAGADKPWCADSPDAPVTTVDTAFDATFCGMGQRRGVTVNTRKVLAAAAAVPEWDHVLVLVNEAEYGGSGGQIAVGTTNARSAEVMQHELGHSFIRLADEYTTPRPEFAACSDLAGSTKPCEANVTNQTDRASLKWKRWLSSTTAVPTTAQPADLSAAGLWEGARYLTTGVYRQCFNGIMRTLGKPFCKVDSEAFVKQLFNGNWGNHPQGLRHIEAGALPQAASLTLPVQSVVNFQAKVAGSKTAGGITAAWYVDGVLKETGAKLHGETTTFAYTVPDTNAHTVELRVTDNTSLVLDPLTTSQSWTIKGQPIAAPTVPGAPALGTLTASGASLTLNFTAPASNGGSDITGYTAHCSLPGGAPLSHSVSSIGPITFSGLADGTYTCQVRASNAVGSSLASNAQSATIKTITATAPGAPSLAPLTRSGSSLTLQFTAPTSNGGAAITGYMARCGMSGGTPHYKAVSSVTPVTFTGLPNGTYNCVVWARNTIGYGAASNVRSASVFNWFGWF